VTKPPGGRRGGGWDRCDFEETILTCKKTAKKGKKVHGGTQSGDGMRKKDRAAATGKQKRNFQRLWVTMEKKGGEWSRGGIQIYDGTRGNGYRPPKNLGGPGESKSAWTFVSVWEKGSRPDPRHNKGVRYRPGAAIGVTT